MRLLIGSDYDYYTGIVQMDTDYGQLYLKDTLRLGRVEYCTNRSYGIICDSQWGDVDASVVCFEIGFSRYGKKTCIYMKEVHKQLMACIL